MVGLCSIEPHDEMVLTIGSDLLRAWIAPDGENTCTAGLGEVTLPTGPLSIISGKRENKAQWLAACQHVSASSQSLRFILNLRIELKFYNLKAKWDSSSIHGVWTLKAYVLVYGVASDD